MDTRRWGGLHSGAANGYETESSQYASKAGERANLLEDEGATLAVVEAIHSLTAAVLALTWTIDHYHHTGITTQSA